MTRTGDGIGRKLVWAVVGLAGLAVSVAAYRHETNAREEREKLAQEVDRLEKKMSHLQGQVAVVGSAAVLGAQRSRPAEAPSPAAPVAPAPATPPPEQQAPEPPHLHTAAEQSETFKNYFAAIDQVRGVAEDRTLTGRLSDALHSVRPEFMSLQKGHVEVLRCGNGVCRIEMTFPSDAELSQAKTELLFQLGPLAGPATMYSNPGESRLFAYFAAPGGKLPPFPKGPA